MHKGQKGASDNESTLAVDSRSIRSPKQRVPVTPQNRPRFNKNILKKDPGMGGGGELKSGIMHAIL